ncbi:glutathione S-transferase [Salmonella enterica subsp. salamae]|nr:glutathione S-transferase [Salmonella enterica subsp. salamae]
MKLFYKPGACSLASHITLREIGKDFTLDGVDLAKKRLENGDDYLAVNPKGQVPALLLDDGTLLTEGVAIMQYLADNVPDRQLLAPVSSLARYHTLEWLNYIATELHKGFTPLFRPDTPETLKPAVRAGLEKKFQYVDGVAFRRPVDLRPAFYHRRRLSVYRIALGIWRKTEYGRVNAH